MSAILRLFVFLLCTLACRAQPLAEDCRQFLLVTAADANQPKAQIQRYQKIGAEWQAIGPVIPAILGRNGLAWGLGDAPVPAGSLQKKEGDNRSPAGIYQITQLWLRKGVAAPPPGGLQVHRIQPDTVGVDDPKSRYYNRILRSSQVRQPDWDSWEKMDISDYDRVLVVSHNLENPIAGRGSCIFIHRWDTPTTPTAGCTAMAESDLIKLVSWLRADARPRLVQLSQTEAESWRRDQQIP